MTTNVCVEGAKVHCAYNCGFEIYVAELELFGSDELLVCCT